MNRFLAPSSILSPSRVGKPHTYTVHACQCTVFACLPVLLISQISMSLLPCCPHAISEEDDWLHGKRMAFNSKIGCVTTAAKYMPELLVWFVNQETDLNQASSTSTVLLLASCLWWLKLYSPFMMQLQERT